MNKLNDRLDTGTTSACAENTRLGGWSKPVMRNYLRVRGEYGAHRIMIRRVPELPPRARRIQPKIFRHGKKHWNYLRVRGEY